MINLFKNSRLLLTLGLLAGVSFNSLAQKENNIWYFGANAGITFNSGSPVVLTNSAMDTKEGTVSVSDANGNLLFYSDGISVWNRNHQTMPNGFGLMGHISATQSVLAVPKPGSPNIYYLFTVDAIENNLANGLRYSILDMSLAGGMGDITTKNVLLENPVTERLTAVKHANGTDFWILAHKWNSNGFIAYQLGPSGLTATPVVSNTGSVHTGTLGNSIGQLKANKKGTKLAVAIRDSDKFELFDFNAATGAVSNPQSSSASYSVAAGVEFSPDGSRLYASAAFMNAVYQFDLNAANVFNSGVRVASNINIPCNLQIAPDGKIYITERDGYYLSVINNPNAKGASCNFVYQGLFLGGKKVWFGLPNFIAPSAAPAFTTAGECAGAETSFTATSIPAGASLTWNFGDPNAGANNTSALPNPTHAFSAPGTYPVSLTVNTGGNPVVITKSITVKPAPKINLGGDTSLCAGQTLLLGKPPVAGQTYKWQDGSTNSTFLVTGDGTFTLEVSQNGCTTTDMIQVAYADSAFIDLGPDTEICEGETILLGKPAAPGLRYKWQDGSSNSTFLVTQPGTYSLQVAKDNCPPVWDEITIGAKECNLFIPNIITPNQDGKNDAFKIRGVAGDAYELRIYNRFAELVYETQSYRNDWDAKDVSSGIFYYQLMHKQTGKVYKGWLEVLKSE